MSPLTLIPNRFPRRKNPLPVFSAPALMVWALAACGGDARDAEEMDAESAENTAAEAEGEAEMAAVPEGVVVDVREVEFVADLEVDLDAMEETETGLFVQVLGEGSGPRAVFGDGMHMHYTLWLPNGTQIDSSHDRGEPLEFVLGSTPLIDGWVEGVTGMRKGEMRRLVIPYNLGYGAEGNPGGIPGYSTLVFEVALEDHVPAGEG